MRAHEQDRLSAYIDRELSPPERGAVESHLRECPECTRRLSELAAVDAAVRELPLQAPAGYFDGFPGRLRRRLRPGARRVGLSRPWLLAAAAGLLLAVLTPATLRTLRAPGPASPAAPARAVPAATLEGPPPSSPPAQAADGKPKADGRIEVEALRERVAAPARPLPPANAERPASTDKTSGDSSRTRQRKDVEEWRGPQGLPQAQPHDEGEEQFVPPVGRVAEQPVAAPSPAAAPAAGYATAPPEADRTPSRLQAAPEVKRRAEPGLARAAAASPRPGPRESREAASTGAGTGHEGAIVSSPQARYEALLARPFGTAAEARALREAWRAFVSDYPAGPWADEARVRILEVGAEAYRLGRDPEDLALLRRDGADYLKLPSARQVQRAREILDSVQ